MVKLGDSTHLRGMRGTAVGVEAAVMTCRICSSAERPPPTWKATWSALFCWGRDRERGWYTVKTRRSQGAMIHRLDGDLRGSHVRGSLSFSCRSDGSKSETKWSQKYSCLISKVHEPTEQSSFNSGQMLCRLKWALGWSQPKNTGWRETEEMASNGPENCWNTSGYRKVLENYHVQKNDQRLY